MSDKKILIALGSNCSLESQGSETIVEMAVRRISNCISPVLVTSRIYRSPAFPKGTGPDYINGAVLIEGGAPAADVLESLHSIEAEFQRQRSHRWAPRTLDLDLIDCDGQVVPDRSSWATWATLPLDRQRVVAPDGLILPHPRVQDRAFVLKPIVDIAPEWRHPCLGETAAELLAKLPAEFCDIVAPITP